MSTFSIKINGLEEFSKSFSTLDAETKKQLQQTMVHATTLVQEEAKRISPGRFRSRTGNLRRSIQRIVESAFRGIIFVDAGAKYGEYVEHGTRPHLILPKSKKMLAFKSGGRLVFARKVNHPGSKPYPFMKPAFTMNVPKITKLYDSVILGIVRRLSK